MPCGKLYIVKLSQEAQMYRCAHVGTFTMRCFELF